MLNVRGKTATCAGLGLAGIMILSLACSNDPTSTPQNEPPTLPPLSSIVMDFSGFSSQASLRIQEDPDLSRMETEGYGNWGFAFLNVAIWNTVLEVTLAVPVASFAEAFNHIPVQQADGTWLWSYSFNVVEVTYHAQLSGTVTEEEFTWEMYISREDGYQDFLWYTGQCEWEGETGTWMFNKSPEDPTPCLRIDWTHDVETDLGELKYTNIEPESPDNGSFIHCGLIYDSMYDGFYDIFNAERDNHTDIEWNETSSFGRVRDPIHYGDYDWHCWDSNLEDTVCP